MTVSGRSTVYGLNMEMFPGLVGFPEGQSLKSPQITVLLLGSQREAVPRGNGEVWYTGRIEDGESTPSVRVLLFVADGHQYFSLRYADGSEFVVDVGGARIWGAWPEGVTLEDALTYFVGPVLGFVLRLRGVLALHASAVAIDGRAVVIAGGAGAGKSTMAAAFAVLGYPVFSDDIAALDDTTDGFWVHPGYPRVNLWPPSLAVLFGAGANLPRITPRHPTWDKCYLDLMQRPYRFQGDPLPLGAIYLLGARSEDELICRVEAVRGSEALVALTANTYANYLLDKDMRAREFDALVRLIGAVPVRRVVPHADPSRVLGLCHDIVKDARFLFSKKSPCALKENSVIRD